MSWGSEIVLKRTSDQSVMARLSRDDRSFSDLVLGGAGELILSTSHSSASPSDKGPYDFDFWSSSGKLLGRFVSDEPARPIVDPVGSSVILLLDSSVLAFDSTGTRLWDLKGRYRKAVTSAGSGVTLLNPRDRAHINQVHVVEKGSHKVIELPFAVHEFVLSREGTRAAIAAGEGMLYFMDVKSSSVTEVSLPIPQRHFITDLEFVDSDVVALSVAHVQDAKTAGDRIVPISSEALLLRFDGTLIGREDTYLSLQSPWIPAVSVPEPGQVIANGPDWLKRLEPPGARPPSDSPRPGATFSPLDRHKAGIVWRRMQHDAMQLKRRLGSNLHGWPLEPQNQTHPLMSVLGELNYYGGMAYQHAGHDVQAVPWTDDAPSATWVAVTVAGEIECFMYGRSSTTNYCDVKGEDGLQYRYMHLIDMCGSFELPVCIYEDEGGQVAATERLGHVVPYDQSFHHLHYQVASDTHLLHSLERVRPLVSDASPPRVSQIVLAREFATSARWTPLSEQGTWANGSTQCTKVSGQVDIVAEISDLDDPGAAPLGLYRVRFNVCPSSNLDCLDSRAGGSPDFSEIPVQWSIADNAVNASTKIQYSVDPNMVSVTSFFTKKIYYVPTNWVGSGPSTTGSWDSSALVNGDYRLTVEAFDFSGMRGSSHVDVCVSNPR